mmetsp:Transcript_177756/g.564074  ORF Transcript_177756/g.564074 Transcript_177756/m.564074 type:complete len:269 (-) Transcript_177756:1241-2047(-)
MTPSRSPFAPRLLARNGCSNRGRAAIALQCAHIACIGCRAGAGSQIRRGCRSLEKRFRGRRPHTDRVRSIGPLRGQLLLASGACMWWQHGARRCSLARSALQLLDVLALLGLLHCRPLINSCGGAALARSFAANYRAHGPGPNHARQQSGTLELQRLDGSTAGTWRSVRCRLVRIPGAPRRCDPRQNVYRDRPRRACWHHRCERLWQVDFVPAALAIIRCRQRCSEVARPASQPRLCHRHPRCATAAFAWRPCWDRAARADLGFRQHR